MTIFQGMNNSIDREIILIERQRSVEVRRLAEAGTATLAVGGLRGASRAQRGRQAREVVGAGRAEQFALTVSRAQEATGRERRVQELSAESFESVGLG